MDAWFLTEEQFKILSNKIINSIEKRQKIIVLNTLQNQRYTLKKPLYITIELEDNTVIAALDDIEAFAYAETEYEAIGKLCEEIVYIYEDLIEDRTNLGPLPTKWLAFLDEVIVSK